jgi:hypothetical protein
MRTFHRGAEQRHMRLVCTFLVHQQSDLAEMGTSRSNSVGRLWSGSASNILLYCLSLGLITRRSRDLCVWFLHGWRTAPSSSI